MRDYEKRWEERCKNRVEQRHGSGHVWTGILLLLIGTVALLRSYVPDFPEWLFSWQMLLIALGLFIGLRHRFHGVAWFVLLLIGGEWAEKGGESTLAIRVVQKKTLVIKTTRIVNVWKR